MPFEPTQEQAFKIGLLRRSVYLQQPETVTDPAYNFSDEDLWNILSYVVGVYSPESTIDSLPGAEFYFPLLLAKKEVYFILASATAPFYPLEAEGASLQKNVRFDHYMELIKAVESAYDSAIKALQDSGGSGGAGGVATIQTYEVRALARYYSGREYNQSLLPSITLTVSGVTSTTANFDWTKFSIARGALFLRYSLYISTKPVIDEYAEIRLTTNEARGFEFPDIHRTKYRVEKLTPATEYYATILSYDRNGRYGYSQQEFTTLGA